MIIKTSDPEFRQIDAACRRSVTDWWRTGCVGSFSTWLHKEWGLTLVIQITSKLTTQSY
jgi:hypothetical protein